MKRMNNCSLDSKKSHQTVDMSKHFSVFLDNQDNELIISINN